MAQAATRGRKPRPRPIVDGYDHVEVASIDSFPASDPPGWIEVKAHPCAEEGASSAECLEDTATAAKRAAAR